MGELVNVKTVCTPLPVNVSSTILELDCATQLKPPEPLVLNRYPLEPPVIVTLPTAPQLVVPETLRVPAMFAPVPVTVIMLALPAVLIVTLPPEVAMLTLLVPLLIDDPPPPPDCATQDRFEEPSVLST